MAYGKNFVVVSDHDLREWIKEKTGIVVKFPFQVSNAGTANMLLHAEIDIEQTNFDVIKNLTLKGGTK
jgi:hypothetical protein